MYMCTCTYTCRGTETQCACTMESTWKVDNPRSAFILFLQEHVIKLMFILNDSLVYALHSKKDGYFNQSMVIPVASN